MAVSFQFTVVGEHGQSFYFKGEQNKRCRKTQKMCKPSHVFHQQSYKRSLFSCYHCFASNLSSTGYSHVSLFFTNEEQETFSSWHVWLSDTFATHTVFLHANIDNWAQNGTTQGHVSTTVKHQFLMNTTWNQVKTCCASMFLLSFSYPPFRLCVPFNHRIPLSTRWCPVNQSMGGFALRLSPSQAVIQSGHHVILCWPAECIWVWCQWMNHLIEADIPCYQWTGTRGDRWTPTHSLLPPLTLLGDRWTSTDLAGGQVNQHWPCWGTGEPALTLLGDRWTSTHLAGGQVNQHSPCWGTGEPALTLLGDRWTSTDLAGGQVNQHWPCWGTGGPALTLLGDRWTSTDLAGGQVNQHWPCWGTGEPALTLLGDRWTSTDLAGGQVNQHSPCWGTGEPALTLLGDRWTSTHLAGGQVNQHSPCWGTGEPALTLLGDRWSCFFSSCLNSSSSRSPERLTSAEAKACFSVSSVSMLICSSIWRHTQQSDQYTETYHGWAQGEQVALTCVPGTERYAKIKKRTTFLDALLSCLFAYLLCLSMWYLPALEQPQIETSLLLVTVALQSWKPGSVQHTVNFVP